MLIDHDRPARRNRARKFRFIFAAFLVVELFAVAEVFFRYIAPTPFYPLPSEIENQAWREQIHRPSETPGLIYELRPNIDVRNQILPNLAIEIKTNSFGMRDREPLPADAPNVYRIAVAGDSFTFGWGVETADQIYTSILEDELNAASKPGTPQFDVLNFGVAGYNSIEEAAVIEHKAMPWNPDLIVIGYFLNDPELEQYQPARTLYLEPRWWQYSFALRAFRRIWYERQIVNHGGGNEFRYLHADGRDEWRSVLRAFAHIREAAAKRKIPVIVAIFPEPPLVSWDNYQYGDLHAKVAAEARAFGFHPVDLLKAFQRHDAKQMRLAPEDNHTTPLGHQVAACELFKKIVQIEPRQFPSATSDCTPRDQ